MMDEDFLNRKEVVWYKRVVIGAVIVALVFITVVIVMSIA